MFICDSQSHLFVVVRVRTDSGKDSGRQTACRHIAVMPHMQEVTSQDSAEDLVSIAPAQEQSSHTDMQEGQREQDQRTPGPKSGLCYLPLFC